MTLSRSASSSQHTLREAVQLHNTTRNTIQRDTIQLEHNHNYSTYIANMPVFDPILRNWIPAIELVIRRGVHYLR